MALKLAHAVISDDRDGMFLAEKLVDELRPRVKHEAALREIYLDREVAGMNILKPAELGRNDLLRLANALAKHGVTESRSIVEMKFRHLLAAKSNKWQTTRLVGSEIERKRSVTIFHRTFTVSNGATAMSLLSFGQRGRPSSRPLHFCQAAPENLRADGRLSVLGGVAPASTDPALEVRCWPLAR